MRRLFWVRFDLKVFWRFLAEAPENFFCGGSKTTNMNFYLIWGGDFNEIYFCELYYLF